MKDAAHAAAVLLSHPAALIYLIVVAIFLAVVTMSIVVKLLSWLLVLGFGVIAVAVGLDSEWVS